MKSFATVALLLIAPVILPAADWDRFRGPNGAGIAAGTAPLRWSSHEQVKWRTRMPGPGTSSPIVVGDRVFVTCWSGYADGSGGSMESLVRHVICLNQEDGAVLWDRAVAAVLPEDPYEGMVTEHGYASSTPVSDGESVYVFFGKSGVLSFDREGRERWRASAGTHSDDRHWGSAASPMIYKGLLIVNALTEGGQVIAFHKDSGQIAWKAVAEDLPLAYGTPVLTHRGGRDELLLAVPRQLWGMDPVTGEWRWRAAHDLGDNVSPGVLVGEGVAYVFGGSPKQRTLAFDMSKAGAPSLLWSSGNSSYVPTPVRHGGHLYVINDQGFALCLEAATGKEVYRERIFERAGMKRRGGGGQPFYASPVLVDGRLYCPSRRNGIFVMAAKPVFELLAVNVMEEDDSAFNASPAADGKRLYLRSDRFIYCFGE